MRKSEYVKGLAGMVTFFFIAAGADWWVEIVLGVLGL